MTRLPKVGDMVEYRSLYISQQVLGTCIAVRPGGCSVVWMGPGFFGIVEDFCDADWGTSWHVVR